MKTPHQKSREKFWADYILHKGLPEEYGTLREWLMRAYDKGYLDATLNLKNSGT
jgi:hypothetical protein